MLRNTCWQKKKYKKSPARFVTRRKSYRKVRQRRQRQQDWREVVRSAPIIAESPCRSCCLLPPQPAQGASDLKLKRSKRAPPPPPLFFLFCNGSATFCTVKRASGTQECGSAAPPRGQEGDLTSTIFPNPCMRYYLQFLEAKWIIKTYGRSPHCHSRRDIFFPKCYF